MLILLIAQTIASAISSAKEFFFSFWLEEKSLIETYFNFLIPSAEKSGIGESSVNSIYGINKGQESISAISESTWEEKSEII